MRCISPFTKRDKNNESMALPCGKCFACIQRRIGGWSFRLQYEGRDAVTAFFVTLTYKDPPTSGNGYGTLNKKDVQDFFKRLRKRHKNTQKKIKYYVVGEYGENSYRPHYHAIIFNAKQQDIEKSWQKLGHVHIGTVSEASIAYTMKYIQKNGLVPTHELDDREKEFATMSKNIGLAYINDKTIKWHQDDILNRCYLNLKGGLKVPMPRYYKEKLYTKRQRKAIGQHLLSQQEDEDQQNLINIVEAKNRKNKKDSRNLVL